MEPLRFSQTPPLSTRARAAIVALIIAAHVLLGLVLVRAFGGVQALASAVGIGPVLTATVITAQPPPPTHSHHDEGASGAVGKRASADKIAAPPARFDVPVLAVAPVAGLGSDTRSGAGAAGEATGGTTSGSGTGAGAMSDGSGGRYVAVKPVKIAGTLAEADYPAAGRSKRLGTSVIVVLTVATDGHVTACRIHQPSGDPDADALTCKLALERFRFRPALDANNAPVESQFGWQQSFFWKSGARSGITVP